MKTIKENERLRKFSAEYFESLRMLIKWLIVGLVIGIPGGLIGAAFCHTLSFVTGLRESYPLLIWLLPLGGVLIVFLYSKCGMHPTDTNGVLLAVHTPAGISVSTGPLIFVGSAITHLSAALPDARARRCSWAAYWAGRRQSSCGRTNGTAISLSWRA